MSEWDDSATQIRGFAFDGADRILIADGNRQRADWLRAALGDDIRVEHSDSSRRVFERLTADPPHILVVGTELADISGAVLLAHAARYQLIGPHHGPTVFLLADNPLEMPAVDEQYVPIFYRLTPGLPIERIRELFQTVFARQNEPVVQTPREDPLKVRQIVEHAKRFGVQTELAGAATVVAAAIVDVCRADRARVLYFDDESGTLWDETNGGADEVPASAGLAGYVVRTGMPLALERAASDPAYRPPVDDPAGSGEERLAIQPVRDRDQHIHAVLFAVRDAKEPPFTAADQRLLQSLAEAWQPYVHQLAQESHARAKADELSAEQGGELFRQEAISHMIRRGHEGDVVRINPAWVSGAYWIVLASLIAAGVFSYFVRIHQYSEGPSIVKATGRSDVIAVDGGTVIEVAVANGDVVKAGQVVARLHDTEQAGRLRGLDAEYERRLVAYLQSPGDRSVGEALGKVVSDRDEAKANVDARAIRAPFDGRIKDLRVRKGQRVDQGTAVAAIVKKDVPEALSVIAFLPGSDRPRLRAHQQLRLTLPGYRGVHFTMEVRAISSEVLGAKEASTRYFGDRIGDSLGAQGTVVVVEGRLASASFEAEGQTFELHDGMIGRAEVQLDSKSVLETILPGIDL